MTVRAVSHVSVCIDQRISVTACTVISVSGRDQGAVIWSDWVERTPAADVTGCTVAGRESLAGGATGHGAVAGVTAGTTVMSIGSRQDSVIQQGVIVTVSTGASSDLNQDTVIRCVDGVGCVPGCGMTGGAVAASKEGLVIGAIGRDQ